jgi:hypothetical protein
VLSAQCSVLSETVLSETVLSETVLSETVLSETILVLVIESNGRRDESRAVDQTGANGFEADSNGDEIRKYHRTRIGVLAFIDVKAIPAFGELLLRSCTCSWQKAMPTQPVWQDRRPG